MVHLKRPSTDYYMSFNYLIRQNGLKLNPNKTQFFRRRTNHLGFVLSENTIEKQSAKIEKCTRYLAGEEEVVWVNLCKKVKLIFEIDVFKIMGDKVLKKMSRIWLFFCWKIGGKIRWKVKEDLKKIAGKILHKKFKKFLKFETKAEKRWFKSEVQNFSCSLLRSPHNFLSDASFNFLGKKDQRRPNLMSNFQPVSTTTQILQV